MIIGGIGSAFISASSLYIALKLGALPWPIVFAALLSLFFLKLLKRTTLNEVNVTHTAMSAGAMVAGGLAFTIPAIWMLGLGDGIDLPMLLLVSLGGVVLGLLATACIRRYFIDTSKLAYPIGVSAAETLLVTEDTSKRRTIALFSGMGIAAIYAFIRDNLGLLPSMLFSKVNIPGVSFGIYNSPMMLAIGFIVGPAACLIWFGGAVIGDLGVVVAGSAAGLWDSTFGEGIKKSLGMGVMLGAGIGILLVQMIPVVVKHFKQALARPANTAADKSADTAARATESSSAIAAKPSDLRQRKRIHLSSAVISAVIACVVSFALGLPLLQSVLLVAGTWVAVFMSSQSVGVSGINPMEVFAIMVLLLIQLAFHETGLATIFLLAAIVAVACGLAGDVMNDFKAGALIGTKPRDQWVAQAIGGVIGAVVASVLMLVLLQVYGAESFGLDKTFLATQASMVATMASGIPNLPAFGIGFVVGLVLACFRLPVMTLGLGIYLPFYFSLTALIGGLLKLAFDKVTKRRYEAEGTAVASGLLGGESLIGVFGAIVLMFTAL
jgi:putative OPT family oligopeptide transporter